MSHKLSRRDFLKTAALVGASSTLVGWKPWEWLPSSSISAPMIEVSGTPYQCGEQYGEAAASQIKENVAMYIRLINHYTQHTREQILAQAETYVPFIEKYNANFMDELRGVASGAGVPLTEIVMLNARSELMSGAPLVSECTGVAIVPPAPSKKVWLAQNWDWLTCSRQPPVVLKVKQPNQPVLLTLAEAGLLGKIGLNEAGVALGLNWLETARRRMGAPRHLICRQILQSASVAQVVQAIYKQTRGCAVNYLVAQRDGFAFSFETMSEDVDVVEPTQGILFHTNHYLSSRLKANDRGIGGNGDSLTRLQRARNLLAARTADIELSTLAQLQRDHVLYPDSICRHPDPSGNEFTQKITKAGIIIDLTDFKMHIAAGNPCQNEYVEYAL